MGILFQYIWTAKVCLLGWSTVKACSNDNGFICGISLSYFCILLLATVWNVKGLPKPREIDAMEGEYLRLLEEGTGLSENRKQH